MRWAGISTTSIPGWRFLQGVVHLIASKSGYQRTALDAQPAESELRMGVDHFSEFW